MGDARTERSNKRSILIVDDDVDIRDTLADFLEDEGYTVGAAANGREALAYPPQRVTGGSDFRGVQENKSQLAASNQSPTSAPPAANVHCAP